MTYCYFPRCGGDMMLVIMCDIHTNLGLMLFMNQERLWGFVS